MLTASIFFEFGHERVDLLQSGEQLVVVRKKCCRYRIRMERKL
jgi:hypothetical protein